VKGIGQETGRAKVDGDGTRVNGREVLCEKTVF